MKEEKKPTKSNCMIMYKILYYLRFLLISLNFYNFLEKLRFYLQYKSHISKYYLK